ncbi:MAG: Ribosome-binding factor A [Alphaproteobacteria bacterium MarineAlpha5_Bin8]|nr:MAG: Ribosome-binding factor A [Alphaproteobacteria bacterium MarineAlpha5_Bin7]PPR48197.1 MAG: Ribosome-binding factor A [Alphaproteobacteria bacterium MarineAlpha5_Bin8]
MSTNQMPTQRQIRYGELIRSIISECLIKEDFYDSPIDIATITISFVRMSKDLRIASVYFMPLGGTKKEDVLTYLNEKKFIFQKSISKAKIKSKFTPKIQFYLDNSFEEAEKVKNLLSDAKVMRDLKNE